MKLCIEIDCDDAKLISDRSGELSRILSEIPSRLPAVIRETGDYSIHDSVGQWVGTFRLKLGKLKR